MGMVLKERKGILGFLGFMVLLESLGLRARRVVLGRKVIEEIWGKGEKRGRKARKGWRERKVVEEMLG